MTLLPPKSADFMPISKFSESIVQKMNCERLDIEDCDDLWKSIQKIFKDLSDSDCISQLLANMPNVLTDVLKNGGNYPQKNDDVFLKIIAFEK